MDLLTYSYESETQLVPGSIVTIPLRKKTSFGMIYEQTNKPVALQSSHKSFDIKEILDIITSHSLLPRELFGYYQHLAKWYGTNLGTMMKAALPPLQKRKLKAMEALPCASVDSEIELTRTYKAMIYTTSDERYTFLREHVDGATLILVPEVQDVEALQKELDKDVILWSSDLSPKQTYDAWMKIHTIKDPVVIGTRSAALLPIPNLKTIILDLAHDENHKAWEGTPKLFVPDVLDIRKRYQQYNEFRSSYTPSLRMLYEHAATFPMPTHSPLHIIDMTEERRAQRFGVLADETKDITTNANGDVLVLVGRRGYATTINCSGCGHTVHCDQCDSTLVFHQQDGKFHCHHCKRKLAANWICNKCGAQIDNMRGYGTELLEEGVSAELAGDIPVIRIDADTDDPERHRTHRKEIIVGTARALNFARWDKVTDIIVIDIDKQLSWPEYDAEERALHLLERLQWLAPKAIVHVQTYTKDHPLFMLYEKPAMWFEKELKHREQFGYPPYTGIIRLLYSNPKPYEASKAAHDFTNAINKLLTTEQKLRILDGPAPLSPSYHRGQHWQAAIAKLPRDHWLDMGLKLLRYVPKSWQIDPSPRNILSL